MESFEALVEIDRPLATDIIRNFDVMYLTTVEVCGNDVVGVDVAKVQLALLCI